MDKRSAEPSHSEVDTVNTNASISDRELKFIENQLHCPLCSSELNITVESSFERTRITEVASCPKCGLNTRVKEHSYH